MLCQKPYMAGAIPFGCGQCMPCRINRRRQWAARQMLESLCHDASCFITLTYNPEHLPVSGSLEPEVVCLWLKRLRKALAPKRVRFFLVGEYGDKSQRPHYHLSLFGVSGREVVGAETVSEIVCRTWALGFVMVADFTDATAAYVGGYITKKMVHRNDPRLEGRVPEFARMSNRPGLGAAAMAVVARTLCASPDGMRLLEESGDVPRELQIGRRRVPLGRYLIRRLRQAVGFQPDYIERIKDAISHQKSTEVLALLEAAFASTDVSSAPTLRSVYLDSIQGKLAQVEGRHKLRAAVRSL